MPYPRRISALLLMLLVAALLPGGALAQGSDPLDQVSFDQKLNAQLPLDLGFVDEQGAAVRLGDYFDGRRPVLLLMGYYECPMLCSLVREGAVQALQQVKLNVGEDFQVVSVSIDPQETPMAAQNVKRSIVSRYNRPGSADGWHFLTGTQDAIQQLADTVGFHYFYDETIDQYAHAAGIMMTTPQGILARYFYGIEYNPTDLRLGLVESSDSRIGNPVDQLLLLCYHYNPITGKYTSAVMNLIRAAGVLTVLGIIGAIALMSRGPRRPQPPSGPAAALG